MRMRGLFGLKSVTPYVPGIPRARRYYDGDDMLMMWTIYDHPRDYPFGFVARRFVLNTPTDDVLVAYTVEELRRHFMRQGLTCMTRAPTDDPVILETWF